MEQREKIGPYLIEAELAQSSICSVLKAWEETLNRPVLLKKLHPQMAREEDVRDRFEREAKVCAHVNHENIVSIYGYHAEPELTMLVLEYVEGLNLGTLISQRGRLPWQIALIMMSDVLQGLAYAHSRGVVHRDLKPDNILISNQGTVKITDFGLATIEDAPKLTRQGMVLGTPAYLPPEGLVGAAIDFRGDLFSFGTTFYEALTGMSPFQGDTFSETMNKLLKFQPPPPSSIDSSIPAELDHILLRLMEKKPTQRFGSAEQALEEVRRLAAAYEIRLDKKEISRFIGPDEHRAADSTPLKTSGNNSAGTGTSIAYPKGRLTPTRSRQSSAQIPLHRPGERPGWIVWLPLVLSLISSGALIGIWINKTQAPPPWAIQNGNGYLLVRPESLRVPTAKDTVNSTPEPTPAEKSTSDKSDQKPKPKTASKPSVERTLVAASDTLPYSPAVKPAPSEPSNTVVKSMRPGQLQIMTQQWANITVDNQSCGQTPPKLSLELSPGAHTVIISNDEFPSPIVLPVEVFGDSTIILDVDLTRHFAEVRLLRVLPWAEVYIDGKYVCQTPRSRPIFLAYGEHTLELRNPNFPVWRKTFHAAPGDEPMTVNVNFQETEP